MKSQTVNIASRSLIDTSMTPHRKYQRERNKNTSCAEKILGKTFNELIIVTSFKNFNRLHLHLIL